MKWYKIEEKLPKDGTLVVIWYGTKIGIVDSRYDPTVYNEYTIAFYEDDCWKDMSGFNNFHTNLADTHKIYKWYEIPFAS